MAKSTRNQKSNFSSHTDRITVAIDPKIMDDAVKLGTPEICNICKKVAFQSFCYCQGGYTTLCDECLKVHCLGLYRISHSFLPSASFGPHLQPGFADRLDARLKAKDRAREEMIKALAVFDTIKGELHVKADSFVQKIQEFVTAQAAKLDTLKAEILAEIDEAAQVVEESAYADKLISTKKMAKVMWEYRGEPIDLVSFSFNVDAVMKSLDSLVKCDRRELNVYSGQGTDCKKPDTPTFVIEKIEDQFPLPEVPLTDNTDEIVAGYFCPYCKQNIKHKYHLKDHFNLHIREYLYKCPLCDVPFMKRNMFKAHIIGSHPEENFRKMLSRSQDYELRGANPPLMCVCQLCNASITSKEALFEHAEIHSERYPCPLCKDSAVELKQMECHIKRHLKDTRANFQCTVCLNKYKNLSTVKKHIDAIHSGISIDAAVKEIQSQANMALFCIICKEPLRVLNQMLQHAEDHSRLGQLMRKRIKLIEGEGDDISGSDKRSESSGI